MKPPWNTREIPPLISRRQIPTFSSAGLRCSTRLASWWRQTLARSRSGGFKDTKEDRRPAGWCPSSLAKLVPITPISLWFMADITIVFMGFINQQTSLGGTILWEFLGKISSKGDFSMKQRFFFRGKNAETWGFRQTVCTVSKEQISTLWHYGIPYLKALIHSISYTKQRFCGKFFQGVGGTRASWH